MVTVAADGLENTVQAVLAIVPGAVSVAVPVRGVEVVGKVMV